MSNRASGYAKSLIVAPNGERISRGEKLVLIVLADNHQDKAKHFTYPSIETIAEDALCDRRSCQRFLVALERKGVIKRLRPVNQGRGMQVFYFFTALDEIPEGWQNAALFEPNLFQQKGGRRAAEGRQKGGISAPRSIGTRAGTGTGTGTKANTSTTPQPPQAGECGLSLFEEDSDAKQETKSTASVAEGTIPEAEDQPAARAIVGYHANVPSEQDLGSLPERCEAAEGVELTAEQLADLERYKGNRDLYEYFEERFREENRAAVLAAEAARVEAARIERMKAMLGTVRDARAWVMRQCHLVDDGRKRGIGTVIDAVLEQQLELGNPLWETAPKMAAARNKFAANGELITTHWGPVKFFKLGIWADERGWGWNEAKLERMRGASVGSAR